MAYLNLDDTYPEHPKIIGLSDAAYRLHGSSLCYASRYLLDGVLTKEQLRGRPRWSARTQRELLDANLLHGPGDPCNSAKCPVDDGKSWRLHDFFQWNKSRSWWESERTKAASRKADWKARQVSLKGDP